jgi:tRNA modification GTPase
MNKCDLVDGQEAGTGRRPGRSNLAIGDVRFRVSAQTGAAFDALVSGLADYAARFFGLNESSLITRHRHRSVLASCAESLDRALAEGQSGREDVIAEELRLAARDLGRLTGRVDVEDVLDIIFRDFCIGK